MTFPRSPGDAITIFFVRRFLNPVVINEADFGRFRKFPIIKFLGDFMDPFPKRSKRWAGLKYVQ